MDHIETDRLGEESKKARWAATRRRVGYLRARCNTPSAGGYRNYGARGIECRLTAEELVDALGHPPPDMDIDRIDNDGHYEIGNVRYVTRSQNLRNRRKIRNPRKLDEEKAWRVHWLVRVCGMSQVRVATFFDIQQPTVSLIIAGKLWGDVKDAFDGLVSVPSSKELA